MRKLRYGSNNYILTLKSGEGYIGAQRLGPADTLDDVQAMALAFLSYELDCVYCGATFTVGEQTGWACPSCGSC